jgi:uncharacterized integral membrane protein
MIDHPNDDAPAHDLHGPDEGTGPRRTEAETGAAARGAAPTATRASSPADRQTRATRASAAWAAVIVALLLLVVLIIFVLQNPTPVVVNFLGWSGSLATGMAMLIAAVTGGLLVATIGVARLTQLRMRARRTRNRQR